MTTHGIQANKASHHTDQKLTSHERRRKFKIKVAILLSASVLVLISTFGLLWMQLWKTRSRLLAKQYGYSFRRSNGNFANENIVVDLHNGTELITVNKKFKMLFDFAEGFSIFRMKATGKEACYMEPLSETLRHMDIPSPDVMFHQLEKAPRNTTKEVLDDSNVDDIKFEPEFKPVFSTRERISPDDVKVLSKAGSRMCKGLSMHWLQMSRDKYEGTYPLEKAFLPPSLRNYIIRRKRSGYGYGKNNHGGGGYGRGHGGGGGYGGGGGGYGKGGYGRGGGGGYGKGGYGRGGGGHGGGGYGGGRGGGGYGGGHGGGGGYGHGGGGYGHGGGGGYGHGGGGYGGGHGGGYGGGHGGGGYGGGGYGDHGPFFKLNTTHVDYFCQKWCTFKIFPKCFKVPCGGKVRFGVWKWQGWCKKCLYYRYPVHCNFKCVTATVAG